MTTAFDLMIEHITTRHYHNHRMEDHSDVVSAGILNDLLAQCDVLRADVDSGRLSHWHSVAIPGTESEASGREIDLLIGEALPSASPNMREIRIMVENKSVITAHRNKNARYQDLERLMRATYALSPEAILVATVVVGVALRYLNVPDFVRKLSQTMSLDFERDVLPRLSSGDEQLWSDFQIAISKNRPDDAEKTIEMFRRLPTRDPSQTDKLGYDYLMIVPAFIDNVHSPYLCRKNDFGIDIDAEYDQMLVTVCRAYQSRWRP